MTPTLDLLVNIRDQDKTGVLADFSSTGSGISSALGTLFRNDGERVRIRAVEPSKSGIRNWDYVDLSTAAVRVAIGKADKTPTVGTFFLKTGSAHTSGLLTSGKRYLISAFIAGDVFTNLGAASNATGVIFTATGTTPITWTNASTLYEITADLAFDASYSAVQTALNATAAITAAGGVTVTAPKSGCYLVAFVSAGAQVLIGWNADNLAPQSLISVSRLVTGSSGLKEQQLVVLRALAPAYAEPATALATAAAVVANLQTGDGSHPSIQRITLSPSPYAGTWTATIEGDSYVFNWNESEASMQAKLGSGFIVTHTDGSFVWIIQW
ncbi:MAG: hypothetical protein QOD99_1912, partial [Chthoniobacter sp.]|nr:hypothetical protein [Chthoniobacter sp.]